jgi:hypothetical protein
MAKAYANIRPGVMLKSIMTSEHVTDGKKNATTMTMALSNVKRASIAASVFEVPADYAQAASPLDALAPLSAVADSLNKAMPRNSDTAGPGGAASTAGETADSVKAAVKQGVVEGAKEEAKDDAKAHTRKALGKIFRRPMQ